MQDCEVFTSKNLIQDPKISIIMPTYCRGDNGLLRRAIDSVLSQSFSDFELIIVDDGSVDRTRQVIEERMEKETRLVYIRNHVNSGLPAIKVMQGYFQSRAPYIAYQFDDDQWKPRALEVLYEGIRSESKDTFVYGACEYIRTREKTIASLGNRDIDKNYFLYINSISNNAVMHHRELFDLYGAYDPSLLLRRVTDWDMWKRWIYSGAKAKRIDSVISVVEEQRAGSLNMTVDRDVAVYKIFEGLDLQSRNRMLTPERYLDCPVDSLDLISHPYMKTRLYYERIYPYYLSRIGKDPGIEEQIEQTCIPPAVLVLFPLQRCGEVPSPFVGARESARNYNLFYMAEEQMLLDSRASRFADVVLADSLERFADREKHLLRQKPLIEMKGVIPEEDRIEYLMKLALVRHAAGKVHLLQEKDAPREPQLEEAVRKITGQLPLYLDAEELHINNLYVDPERFQFELRERLAAIGAEAVIDLTGDKQLTKTLRESFIPSLDIEEIRQREKIMSTEQALLFAFFHQTLYIRALREDRIDPVRRKEEIVIEAQSELSEYPPEVWKGGAMQESGREISRPLPEEVQSELARKNLEIENLKAEILRLKEEQLHSLGYLTERERKEIRDLQSKKIFAADLRDLCGEEESLLQDKKIALLRHITGDYHKKTANYLDVLAHFPEDDRRGEGWYLAKSPCLRAEAAIAYQISAEQEKIDRLQLCFTNYNPAAAVPVLELRITDSSGRLLRSLSLRGWEILHREPTQLRLGDLLVPEDHILRLYVIGSAAAFSSGVCIFEWKKRGLLGKTKDQKPLLRIL